MTPVINPWIFYIMPICENLSTMMFALSIVLLMAIVILAIAAACNIDYGDEDTAKKFMQTIKKLIPFLVIVALLACLIPTEETITKMIVAQNVTVERVDVAFDTVVNVYNDIMNLFQDSGAANG